MVEVTGELKAEMLRRIVESPGFHRSEVLKTLLAYLCRQEGLGRAHEVTEYEIAVQALGRPPGFSPETDSSVRTRLMALRRKLEEYYAGEGRDAEIRVDIPRGTYVLRFVPAAAAAAPEMPEPAPGRGLATPRGWTAMPPTALLAGALVGVLACAAVFVGWGLWTGRSQGRQEELLRRAWGPMLERGSGVTVVIGTPVSLFVQDFGNAEPSVGDPVYRLPVPRDQAFEEWYKQGRGRTMGRSAILHPTIHSPLWGDAAAASVVSRLMGAHGVTVETAPGARVHPVALREKNTVIVGRPEYTDAAGALLPEEALRIEYSREERRVGVHNPAARMGEPKWWFMRDPRHNFGLITVLSPEGPAKKRTVLFSGINSDGSEAGARFLTSTESLSGLDARFRQAGLREWPARYQIVVRTDSMDSYTLEARLEFLRILK